MYSQEEALAKQAPSSYPEAEVILNSIVPFLHLYQLFIDWDEAEKEYDDLFLFSRTYFIFCVYLSMCNYLSKVLKVVVSHFHAYYFVV